MLNQTYLLWEYHIQQYNTIESERILSYIPEKNIVHGHCYDSLKTHTSHWYHRSSSLKTKTNRQAHEHYCSCVTSVKKNVYINMFIRIWLANHMPVSTFKIPCDLRSDFKYMWKTYSIHNNTANRTFCNIVHRLCQGFLYFQNAIWSHDKHKNVTEFMPTRKVRPSLHWFLQKSCLTALCADLILNGNKCGKYS